MKMRFCVRFYLTTAIALLSGNAVLAQYITLTAGYGKAASQTVTLVSNDLATVVHLFTPTTFAWLEVLSGGVTNRYFASTFAGGSGVTYSVNLPVIAGPATIRAVSNGLVAENICTATLQITKPTSTFVPVNTVVIPNDSGAPVQIILESSTDMIKWNAASPGTYGTSTTNRFFRVRAER